MNKSLSLLVLLMIASLAHVAHAADATPPAAERVNIDALKKKFGSTDTNLSIVQNRLYTKSSKLELGVFGGLVSADAFLDIKNAGFLLGYHFSEYVGLNALYWKDSFSPSEALQIFESTNGYTVNTSSPQSLLGGEIAFNPIYGKLSVMNNFVIYYDLHVSAGVGKRVTETGSYITPIIGIGQQIYLSKVLSMRLDYRLLRFKEDIKEKVTGDIGSVVATRTNVSSVITFGLDLLLGF